MGKTRIPVTKPARFLKTSQVWELIYLVTLTVVSAVLCFLCIHEGHVWGDDFAMYIHQSQSLLDGSMGDLYKKNVYLTDNSEILEGGPIGPYLYPMGFPLLLSGAYSIMGLDFFGLKIFCSLFFILSLPLIYLLLSTRFSNSKYALLATAYVGLNFVFLEFSDNILSDFPFFFFILLSLYLMDKNRLNMGYQLLLSAAIIMTYLIRDIGLVLIPVLMTQLYFKAEKEENNVLDFFRKNKLFIVPIAFFCVFWLSKSLFLETDNSNLFTALSAANIKTIVSNTGYYIFVLGELWGANSQYILRFSVLFLFGLFFLKGIYKSEKRDWHFILLIVLTMGLYILFPGRQGLRYLFPIVPFVFYFSIQGVLNAAFLNKNAFLINRITNAPASHNFPKVTNFWKVIHNGKVNLAYTFLIILAAYLGTYSLYKSLKFRAISTDQIMTNEAQNLYNWVKTNTSENAIIAFKKPRLLRLMTRRNGFTNSDDAKVLQSKATYLIENDKPKRADSLFNIVYLNEKFIVYKINKIPVNQ
jgi:Dolichyl-phosphate-mannose-protein mannosyltransferase